MHTLRMSHDSKSTASLRAGRRREDNERSIAASLSALEEMEHQGREAAQGTLPSPSSPRSLAQCNRNQHGALCAEE